MGRFKKLFVVCTVLLLLSGSSITGLLLYYSSTLPPLFSVDDYKPLLVSEVYARNGEKIGEFYRENRKLIDSDTIPEELIQVFLAAEDSSFYSHRGFNFKAMIRALIANLTSGKKIQGASTITQQTARTLFLSNEKTYSRKIKEAILAGRMERRLSKKDILYLYLNQIYFGQGAYGIASAGEIFFRKEVQDLNLAEIAVLVGTLTAPSVSNIVINPKKAKIRQKYVLNRLLETGRIDENQFNEALNQTLIVNRKKKYKEVAPYFVETIRQLLVKELGEEKVLNEGLKIYSSLDFKAQKLAQESVRKGLRELDKRQGFRGAKQKIDLENKEEITEFLTRERNRLIDENYESFQVFPDGTTDEYKEFSFFQQKDDEGMTTSNIPPYIKEGDVVEALVTEVDDENNLVFLHFAEAQGLIPLKNMLWARKPDPNLFYSDHLHIKKVSEALSPGDVVDVRVVSPTALQIPTGKSFNRDLKDYAELALEQEPRVESALLSYDLKTDDIIAMVGGSNFKKTKLNRTYQSVRQTGSAFKPILYSAGLDRGLTPASSIMGAPIVYRDNEEDHEESNEQSDDETDEIMKTVENSDESNEEEEEKVWKPHNYGGRFTGDILLRNALKKSLNTPTIRILEKTGVSFAAEYARRLGLFSPINMDMSMALGSSGATLYEMTKIYSVFARLGKKIRPVIIHEIKDRNKEIIAQNISMDLLFKEQINHLEKEFIKKKNDYEEKLLQTGEQTEQIREVSPFFFTDPSQLISPQTAYLVTSLLQAVVNEAGGTGSQARRLNRDIGAKTGTTNKYHDAWFIGYSPQISTGVWMGYDQEKPLGRGETGSRAVLPVWLNYMSQVLYEVPNESFPIPNNIVFANIDNETGQLATAQSHEVVRQAFFSGTEPGLENETEQSKKEEENRTDFYREEF